MTAGTHEEPRDRSDEPVATTREGNWKSSPIMGLVFALVTGLLIYFILSQYHPVFMREEARDGFGNMPPKIQAELDWKNATFVFGLLGGLIAAGIAVAEGFARKSIVTIIVFGVLCAVGGAAAGAGAGFLGNKIFQYYQGRPDVVDLNAAIRVYVAIFAMVGAGVGLVTGIFLGRNLGTATNCFFGGLLAGVGAGFAYPVICALAIPQTDTNVLIPIGTADLLLWCCLTAGLIGLVIPALASKKK